MQPYTSSVPDLSHQNPSTNLAPSCLPPASIQKPDVENHLCTLFANALTVCSKITCSYVHGKLVVYDLMHA